MTSKRNSHAGKAQYERDVYLGTVAGPTHTNMDLRTTDATSSEEETPQEKPSGRRKVNLNVKVSNYFREHWLKYSVGILISILGFILIQYVRLNTDVTVGAEKIKTLEDEQVANRETRGELEKIKFQIDELWEKVFKTKGK